MTKITKNKYGKYSNEIDKILKKITDFSLDDRSRLGAAYAYAYAYAADAAADADAAAHAADDAAAYAAAYAAYAYAADAAYFRDNYWKFRRVFWYAILAWLAKDKITQSKFDLLTTGYNYYTASEKKEVEPTQTASVLQCVSTHLLSFDTSGGGSNVLPCGCSYEFKFSPSFTNTCHKGHVFQVIGYENA